MHKRQKPLSLESTPDNSTCSKTNWERARRRLYGGSTEMETSSQGKSHQTTGFMKREKVTPSIGRRECFPCAESSSSYRWSILRMLYIKKRSYERRATTTAFLNTRMAAHYRVSLTWRSDSRRKSPKNVSDRSSRDAQHSTKSELCTEI